MSSRHLPLVVAAGLLTACSHKPPATTPAPAAVAVAPSPTPPPAAAPAATDDDAARRAAAARGTLADMTFFDFNRADLTAADKTTLDAKVPILNANPDVRVRIAGNCDDRGSEEYNLVLGERRASMAKRYLSDYGIDASRLDVISYGRERPIAQGDDEAAWAKNRNDQFVIVAGGEHLRGVTQ